MILEQIWKVLIGWGKLEIGIIWPKHHQITLIHLDTGPCGWSYQLLPTSQLKNLLVPNSLNKSEQSFHV